VSGSAARPATTTTTTTVAPAAGTQSQRPVAGAAQAPLATPAAPRVN
jgi:hypothetical protein